MNRIINKLEQICAELDDQYGSPDLFNKEDPLDELIFIILSSKTTEASYIQVYNNLKKKYPHWEMLLETDLLKIQDIIKPAGLAKLKTKRIIQLLRDIKEKNSDNLNLSFLSTRNDQEAERYLLSLYGVGYKTAKCVLLYSLKRKVLPVDIHTYEFSREIGLVSEVYMRNEKGKLHKELEDIIPPELRYTFHVNAVMHRRIEHPQKKHLDRKCELIQFLELRQILPL